MSINIKNFKISATKIAAARKNMQSFYEHGGDNTNPLANPIHALFGSWEESADLPDFFKDAGKKKTLKQYALTLGQLLELVQKSYDPVSLKVDTGAWEKLSHDLYGAEGQPEGSAFTCKELESLAYGTREHYKLVSVASGFDWSARGLNTMSLLKGTGMSALVPRDMWDNWSLAVLVSIWVIYEGLGLSGYNAKVIKWHAAMRFYCRKGHLDKFDLGILEGYRATCPRDYDLLWAVFKDFLKSEGIQQDVVNNQDMWEVILFLAHGREIQSQYALRGKLSQHLGKYTLGDLSAEETQFLVLASQLQRAAAKGKLSLDEGDEYETPTGLVHALNSSKFDDMWDMLKGIQRPNIGVKMLLDVFPILSKWSATRSQLIEEENNM